MSGRFVWQRMDTYFRTVGECVETNRELAERFGTSLNYASQMVTKLERQGRVVISVDRMPGRIDQRRITHSSVVSV